MKESIKLAIKTISINNLLEFKENGRKYKIVIDDIIYIKKEKYRKYCTIKTTDTFFRVRDTITNLKQKTKFPQIKKDLLINDKYITNINDIDRIL